MIDGNEKCRGAVIINIKIFLNIIHVIRRGDRYKDYYIRNCDYMERMKELIRGWSRLLVQIFPFIHQWLYSPLLVPSLFFSFVIILHRPSACRKAATYTQNKCTQASIPWVWFETTIPAFERAKTVHSLDRAGIVIGVQIFYFSKYLMDLMWCLTFRVYTKICMYVWGVGHNPALGQRPSLIYCAFPLINPSLIPHF
jgi:hypothetical protein